MNLFDLMGIQAPVVEKKAPSKKATKPAAKSSAPETKYELPKMFNILGVMDLEVTPEMAGGNTTATEKDILAAVVKEYPWVVTEKGLFVEGDCVLVRASAGMAKGEIRQEVTHIYLGAEDLLPALQTGEEGLKEAEEVTKAIIKARPGYAGVISGVTEGGDGSLRVELRRAGGAVILMPKESLKILTLGGDCVILTKEDCAALSNAEKVTEYSTISKTKLAERIPWKTGKEYLEFLKIGDDSFLAVTAAQKKDVAVTTDKTFDISGGAVIFDNGNEIPVGPENFSGKTTVTPEDIKDFLINEQGRRHYNVMPIVVSEFKKGECKYLHVGVKSSTKGAFDDHPFFRLIQTGN